MRDSGGVSIKHVSPEREKYLPAGRLVIAQGNALGHDCGNI